MVKKILIVSGIVALIVVFVVVNKNKSRNREKYQINAEVVKKRTIKEWVEGDGTLRAMKQVSIGSDVMGRIEKIYVREGDIVHRGDTLLKVDPSTYMAKVNAQKARLAQDIVNLKQSKVDLERAQGLYSKGFISKKAFEDAQNLKKRLTELVVEDKSLLLESERELSKTAILSPIKGEVIAVYKEEGEMAIAGTINTPGSVIMSVAGLDTFEAKVLVDETEMTKIKLGQFARVTVDALADSVIKGRVRRIVGMPESSGSYNAVVSYPVYIILSGKLKLLPGMSVNARILVSKADSVPSIPVESIGMQKRRFFVWKITGDSVKKVFVKKGTEGMNFVQIESGLNVHDTVAVGPSDVLNKLKTGSKIRIKALGTGRKRYGNYKVRRRKKSL